MAIVAVTFLSLLTQAQPVNSSDNVKETEKTSSLIAYILQANRLPLKVQRILKVLLYGPRVVTGSWNIEI